MSKSLSVVALVLLVLSGAMGLRNAVTAKAATSTVASFAIAGIPCPGCIK